MLTNVVVCGHWLAHKTRSQARWSTAACRHTLEDEIAPASVAASSTSWSALMAFVESHESLKLTTRSGEGPDIPQTPPHHTEAIIIGRFLTIFIVYVELMCCHSWSSPAVEWAISLEFSLWKAMVAGRKAPFASASSSFLTHLTARQPIETTCRERWAAARSGKSPRTSQHM